MTVLRQLSVRRGREAVELYERASGAEEVYRVGGTDDHPDVVAQLVVGGASFRVSDESPDNANFSAESHGGGTVPGRPGRAAERPLLAGILGGEARPNRRHLSPTAR